MPNSSIAPAGESYNEAGFTLIEVIVALVILSLGLLTVFRIVHSNVEREHVAQEQQVALLIAESRMASVGRDVPLRPGDFQAQANDWTWHIHIAQDPHYLNPPSPVAAYDVAVSVMRSAETRPVVTLRTLLLGSR